MTTESERLDLHSFRTDRPGIRKVLGDLEAEIMELIWEQLANQGTAVREVFEILYERRRIAYTTVMSTMSRLAKKGLLRVEKKEQSYIYYPNFTKNEFISRFVGHIIEDLFVSFSSETLADIGTCANSETTDHLRQLLYELNRRRKQEEA
jgi:predicted transcriptional regulator